MTPQLIMIAGPYKSNTHSPKERQKNLDKLNEAAYQVFTRGHIPIVVVNAALPLICKAKDMSSFDIIMMTVAKALAEICHACLRTEGISEGADKEVGFFREAGKPVYSSLEQIPDLS